MLELAILGVLKEQELHGYELKKRLSDTLGFASGVSFGSLYPALARLEQAGAVKVVDSHPGAAIPSTGSLTGELAALRARKAATRGSRGKKVYAITPRGEQMFEELLATEHHSSFNLRLSFARYLPPDVRLGMLERRRAQLLDRLEVISARLKAARDSYAISLVEHDQETAEHDLSWIDRLIEAERAAANARPPRRSSRSPRTAGRALNKGRPTPPSISGLRPVTSQEESSI